MEMEGDNVRQPGVRGRGCGGGGAGGGEGVACKGSFLKDGNWTDADRTCYNRPPPERKS